MVYWCISGRLRSPFRFFKWLYIIENRYLYTVDLTTKWALALYGWALFNIFVFYYQKQRADRKKEDFQYLEFIKSHVDDWLVTLAVAPLIVGFGQEIHSAVMDVVEYLFGFRIKWYDLFYAGPGPFVEFLYFCGVKLWPVVQKKILSKFQKGQSNGQT